MWSADVDDYMCFIDADDEYKPDFLEKMVRFINEYKLDIAVGGNDFIDPKNNEIIEVRKLNDILILENEGFSDFFPIYHRFARTVWGKLYTVKTMRLFDHSRSVPNLLYGGDTCEMFERFRNASRVGIYPEAFYKYYVYPKSTSKQFDPRRIESDQILHNMMIRFLKDKVGYVNDQNNEYLLGVYLNAVNDTLKVIYNSELSIQEKHLNMHWLFTCDTTKELASHNLQYFPELIKQREDLFNSIFDYNMRTRELRSDEGLQNIAEIFAAIKIYPFQFENWNDLEIFTLLLNMRAVSEDIEFIGRINNLIKSLFSDKPLLVEFNTDELVFFKDIIISILTNNLNETVLLIANVFINNQEVPLGSELKLLLLGLNVAAKLELSDYFVYFKKLHISFLIDLGEKELALAEISDWESLLPGDEDLGNLRNRLI